MYIILFTHGACIAQLYAYLIQGFHHFLLAGGFRERFTHTPEAAEYVKRTGPGAEILGSELEPRYLSDIVIHHTRIDASPVSVRIIILKQFFARYIPAGLHDPGQPLVL